MATGEELAGFEAPTLVFACDEDVFFPGEAVAKRAREIVPNLAGVEVLEGSRHVPSRRSLEHVNAKITELLQDNYQPTLLPGLAPHQRRAIDDRVCPQHGAPESDRFLGREGES
jgi:hypothetical protein